METIRRIYAFFIVLHIWLFFFQCFCVLAFFFSDFLFVDSRHEFNMCMLGCKWLSLHTLIKYTKCKAFWFALGPNTVHSSDNQISSNFHIVIVVHSSLRFAEYFSTQSQFDALAIEIPKSANERKKCALRRYVHSSS